MQPKHAVQSFSQLGQFHSSMSPGGGDASSSSAPDPRSGSLGREAGPTRASGRGSGDRAPPRTPPYVNHETSPLASAQEKGKPLKSAELRFQ